MKIVDIVIILLFILLIFLIISDFKDKKRIKNKLLDFIERSKKTKNKQEDKCLLDEFNLFWNESGTLNNFKDFRKVYSILFFKWFNRID